MIGDLYFQQRADLDSALFSLQLAAGELRAPAERLSVLQQLQQQLREPFLFVALGEPGAGKGTLLDALFGRECFTAETAPAPGCVSIFRYAGESSDESLGERMRHCHRPAAFLRNFHVVDPAGAAPLPDDRAEFARRFLAHADLVLIVIDASAPSLPAPWEFLRSFEKAWLERVVFVVQKADLCPGPEIAARVEQVRQAALQHIGTARPVFAVPAKKALEEKLDDDLPTSSGFIELERFIDSHVAGDDAPVPRVRGAADAALAILNDLRSQVAAAKQTAAREADRAAQLEEALAEQKEHSVRQVERLLWDIAQAYEKAQKRGESVLAGTLAPVALAKLILGKSTVPPDFQRELEEKLRDQVQRQVATSLELIDADFRSIWKQLHDALHAEFPDAHPARMSAPDFTARATALRQGIEPAFAEPKGGESIESRLAALFAETAKWLRIPASVAVATALVAVGISFFHVRGAEILGTLSVLAVLAGIVIAYSRWQKIRALYGTHIAALRETVLNGVDDPLRKEVARFYAELEPAFLPVRDHCASRLKQHTPIAPRLDALATPLEKFASPPPQSSSSSPSSSSSSPNNPS